MSIVTPISNPNAIQDFVCLWSKLYNAPEVHWMPYQFGGMDMQDAVRLGRMVYSLGGSQLRGMRIAGSYRRKYILVFGEYGHLILDFTEQGIVFAKSQSYHFYDKLEEPTRLMDELVTNALLAGLHVCTLVQWYDSVYRRQSGRHVSPNFDPVKSLDKSSAAIVPGLQVLKRLRNTPEEERHVSHHSV